MNAILILENGSKYNGISFGYNENISGEVVFSTNMSGYIESFTDPSFCTQLLCLTYPLIGNYGVPSINTNDKYGINKNLESSKIWIGGLLISDYCDNYSHYQAEDTLSNWLISQKIPALYNIDTRRLTKELREKGSLRGKIIFGNNYDIIPFISSNNLNLVNMVSTKKIYTLGNGNIHIGLLDCGVKYNIIRSLLIEGFKISILPHDYDFNKDNFDGIFISNGPGDPSKCDVTINNIKKYINNRKAKPLFGICLGNQLLALASGAKTYKMKYGNRGYNQPVLMLDTNKTYITSQNHGYAVDVSSLSSEWKELCINKNDNSNEGIYNKYLPFKSVQFHPEARGGPMDTNFMFKDFYNQCVDNKYGKIDSNKILLLGSGGLSIGQAGEFDYSGSQAVKAFKKKGYKVILVNPNIATIQTEDGFADQVYYLPVTPEFVTDIIIKERPKYVSLSFGGQTALNCGIDLYNKGIFFKYNITVLGTSIENILKTEDRDLFNKSMSIIGETTPKSAVALSVEEGIIVANEIGYPVLVRAAFALGGLGSGFCNNDTELKILLNKTFTKAKQVLIDEDLRGWKEVEYEVMRDTFGNSNIICNMENFDPLGIHTGDSIVVAPSQTLNNDEYNLLRTASLKIANSLGIIGECNVQIALDPKSSNYKIIEVNPRLSRSSALASKATGYPIASVAADLCLGCKLYEITNAITGNTTANFEPSLDYVVIKIPRWDTRKFSGVCPKLGSAMKSVGEVMSIGRNFQEAFQKGLRMVNGYSFVKHGNILTKENIIKELTEPTDDRVRCLAQVIYDGTLNIDEIYNYTKIDYFYLHKLFDICNIYNTVKDRKLTNIDCLDNKEILNLKKNGFSDCDIGNLVNSDDIRVSNYRRKQNINIITKQIDTLAGEFPSKTNYLYTTYNGTENDNIIDSNKKTIIILGSGKYRIGSSVEFDYCVVKCITTVRKLGYRTVTINYNPETTSTDFDNSDILYFDEITYERVTDIYNQESAFGIIISMGGQEPNNIALKLKNNGYNVLGTDPTSIDLCEDRNKYSNLLDNLNINQPQWIVANNLNEINEFINKVEYPILVRPSYVLSGAAMKVIYDSEQLTSCLEDALDVSPNHPVVLTKFLNNCIEVDVDCVCKDGNLIASGISEHLENAGVHSGDATLICPPHSLDKNMQKKLLDLVSRIGKTLNISGIFNTQFIIKDEWIGVIETNLRASRSVPFISKTLNIPFISLATKCILGLDIENNYLQSNINYVGVKCPQFSFERLPEADPLLNVEMSSTGEVACFGRTINEAYLKSLIASKFIIKRNQSLNILQLDNIVLDLSKYNHHLIHLKDFNENQWPIIDLVVDLSNSQITKKLRRNAIDFSKSLITNKQQLDLLLNSLTTNLQIQPYSYYKNLNKKRQVNLFIRQGFTETNKIMQSQLQSALNSLNDYTDDNIYFNLLTGTIAESKDTFRKSFALKTGLPFNPKNFRNHRIQLLEKADAMIIFRTGLSESTVFEIAYNIMKGKKIPIFFVIHPDHVIKTTLIRDLNEYLGCKVEYKIVDYLDNILNDPDFISFIKKL